MDGEIVGITIFVVLLIYLLTDSLRSKKEGKKNG